MAGPVPTVACRPVKDGVCGGQGRSPRGLCRGALACRCQGQEAVTVSTVTEGQPATLERQLGLEMRKSIVDFKCVTWGGGGRGLVVL